VTDNPQRRACEACGIEEPRVHVSQRRVSDDKFAVVVRECMSCGCNNARPCGTKAWTCEFCGESMKLESEWVSEWKHHDKHGSKR
jgi:hypothetical protein